MMLNSEREYWVFPNLLAKYYAALTRPYDLDAMEAIDGRSSKAPLFCSTVNSVFTHKLRGLTIWCNPAFSQIERFVKYSLAEFKYNSSSTSLVLVVPAWTNKRYWHLLQNFRLLDLIPSGTHLFQQPSVEDGVLMDKGPTRWDTMILYYGSRYSPNRAFKASLDLLLTDRKRLACVAARNYCITGNRTEDEGVLSHLHELIAVQK